MSKNRILLYFIAFVLGSFKVIPLEGDTFWIVFIISAVKPFFDIVHKIVNHPVLSFLETISVIGLIFRFIVNIVSGVVNFVANLTHLNTVIYIVFYLCVGMLLGV